MTHSDYMHFAKTRTAARYNLASSGIADCTLEDLALAPGDVALHGANAYGHAPLIDRLAARFRTDPACIVTAGGGTSFANHLALATLLAPGDAVLIEHPTYPLITDTLRYLSATIRTFARTPESGWGLDADAIAAALTPATRLVICTNLHNPTGARADPPAIAAIAAAAARTGAHLLIDEVYLELLATDGDHVATAFRADGNIVVTGSLTKAYGLSGLRCGWILAPGPLAERMRRLNDLFGSLPAHPVEGMAVAALNRIAHFRARANARLAANRAAYDAILGTHPALEHSACPQGTTMFPRLRTDDGDTLYATLMDRYETSLVPGRFFGCPAHVRIGLGGDPAATREGLSRVAAALTAAL